MVLGLLLLADVIEKIKLLSVVSLGDHWVTGLKPIGILTFAVVLGVVANPLLESFVFGSDPEKVALARQELTAIGRDLEDKEGVDADLIRSNELVGSRILYGLRSGWLYFEDRGHFARRLVPKSLPISGDGKPIFSILGTAPIGFACGGWNRSFSIRLAPTAVSTP